MKIERIEPRQDYSLTVECMVCGATVRYSEMTFPEYSAQCLMDSRCDDCNKKEEEARKIGLLKMAEIRSATRRHHPSLLG